MLRKGRHDYDPHLTASFSVAVNLVCMPGVVVAIIYGFLKHSVSNFQVAAMIVSFLFDLSATQFMVKYFGPAHVLSSTAVISHSLFFAVALRMNRGTKSTGYTLIDNGSDMRRCMSVLCRFYA